MGISQEDEGFDLGAAVTRSLLGWGVVAGVFYLIVGIVQGVLRDGFSFVEHPLSLLMLGDFGWVQRANLILTGLMVIAAAIGFRRAMEPDRRATRTGIALGTYGLALSGAGVFPPDPVDGFPEPGSAAEATISGLLHLTFGGIGFVALAAAAFFMAGWLRDRNEKFGTVGARLTGCLILIGFIGGAALATSIVGVVLLWVAVFAGWLWLSTTSLHLYRVVPHPDLHIRQQTGGPPSTRAQI